MFNAGGLASEPINLRSAHCANECLIGTVFNQSESTKLTEMILTYKISSCVEIIFIGSCGNLVVRITSASHLLPTLFTGMIILNY